MLATISDKRIPVYENDGLTVAYYDVDLLSATDYYPFGMQMPGRVFNGWGYRYGFNGQEKSDEIKGEENSYTAEFWEYDSRLGRRWNTDPKPHPSISNYATFANNPIFNIDVLGDTTYRFNKSDGKYLGMFDTDAFGQIGSYGSMKSIGKGKNKQEIWDGLRFEFADPQADAQQIRDGIIDKLIFVSNGELKGILTSQGAFKYDNKNSLRSFYKKSKGGQPFDYSYSLIPTKYASQGASSDPLNSPSPMLFLPEGDYTVHNHMNFGNYLWAASGFTLGFSYATLQLGAHFNSKMNSGSNGYPSKWDSEDDQNSIKKGAFHAQQFKYRTILELRHQAEIKKKGGSR
ncbi:polymorphic toxin type 44 domain-containing protein [Chitinophaga caeni]|uniref:polymorphic toxin type 44 domain-containing protein n=1 Tax=Chitinophaga caeni TaxID=2029983 RepID=UPI0012FE629E|nr:polymorphic toxin type 44 domain-containing protein [Chitinophaga caeni]